MQFAARPGFAPFRAAMAQAEPFRSVEEAWFWTMAGLIARRDGARIVSGAGLVPRPCEPDDVVKCLDRLYRQRRIELLRQLEPLDLRDVRNPLPSVCLHRERSSGEALQRQHEVCRNP